MSFGLAQISFQPSSLDPLKKSLRVSFGAEGEGVGVQWYKKLV
jgi:hypothetical protein